MLEVDNLRLICKIFVTEKYACLKLDIALFCKSTKITLSCCQYQKQKILQIFDLFVK